jgi:hypothetical protein
MSGIQSESLRRSSVQYLRRAEAARYIQDTYGFPCSRQWLAKLAVVGGGPIYRKAGRTPIYSPRDLDQWATLRIGGPRRSTSDNSAQAGRSPTRQFDGNSPDCSWEGTQSHSTTSADWEVTDGR